MPLVTLGEAEIETFLAAQRVVRIAFQSDDGGYLVPLGYVWYRGALCGSMSEGRKTRLAREDPRVTFQVDDTLEAGLWEWTSVTGAGRVELVNDPLEVEKIEARTNQRWSDVPDWLAREWEARRARKETVCFRVVPRVLTGCRSARPPEGGFLEGR